MGVGAGRDALKVRGDLGLAMQGVVNLEDFARNRMIPGGGASGGSLASLTAATLGRLLPKPPALRLSNWEARPLSWEQVNYACLDAYAGLRVYEVSSHQHDLTACLYTLWK